jgi:arginyl-tRNA synthetase
VLYKLIEQRVQSAVAAVLPDANLAIVQVRPTADPKFGDYQCNALMSLAKERKRNPRQLAEEVLKQLDVTNLANKVEIAGAGFLNFHASPDAIANTLLAAHRGEHLFLTPAARPRTYVVDFSAPNVAKPMHVGHIRSTGIGDVIARTLRHLGHRVITDNHIGDWGTQFGQLLIGWKKYLNREALERAPLEEMGRLYKKVHAEFEADDAVKTEARQELVKLQNGDPENLALWQEMIRLSLREFQKIYDRLGVKFDHVLGESFYNPQLKAVVQDLVAKSVARESEGAIVVFFDQPDLKETPMLIQKSDGAALYSTTDLATLTYRIDTWHPDEIVYVTDGRQQLHFRQLFAAFNKWKPAAAKLSHVWFGAILGPDNKPFKTRSGETVKLADLLDEAEQRALEVVRQKNNERKERGEEPIPESDLPEIARIVGIGAIKYADLLPNRQSDYVFSWEKMLALTGNTAPYLQYAYTRLRGIARNAEEVGRVAPRAPNEAAEPTFQLAAPEELAVAKHLFNFGLVLEAVAEEYRPNYLCNYLYDLAGLLSRFYEQCPVLKSTGQTRIDRLALCELSARVLKQGLTLLGIETTERM